MSHSAPASAPRSASYVLACALLVVGHVGLVVYFIGWSRLIADVPFQGDDYDTHIGQTYRVIEGLTGWGRSWVYDVELLAGNPAGVIFDADNKGWAMWSYALHRLGLSRARAFNSFVLVAHLLAPLCLWLTARLLRYHPWAALAAAGAGSLLWFFDSFCHWVWWVGMVSYGAGICLSLVVMALLYRYLEELRPLHALGCALLLPAVLLIHPYTFFMLAPPLGLLYLRARSTLPLRGHLWLAGIVASALLGNAYWLHNAYRHWHYILDSAYFGQPGLSYLVADLFNLLLDPSDTGVIGTRASYRFVFLGLALGTLWLWRRQGDRRWAPLGLALASMFAFAYLGAYIPFAGQIQPYRHVVPLCMLSALLSGWFIHHWAQQRVALWPRGLSRLPFALVLLLAFQQLAHDAMYFMPRLLPKARPLIDGREAPITTIGYPRHLAYDMEGHHDIEEGIRDVTTYLRRTARPGSRILVERTLLGERLAWQGDFEIIGGFRLRNLAHARANLFRSYEPRTWRPAELRHYLSTFGVGFVVTADEREDFAQATDILQFEKEVGGHFVYRTRFPVSVVLRGGLPATTVKASTNRIIVQGSDPQADVVLAYHFHEALRCGPACRIERQPIDIDPVGFIRVPVPHPANFVIENSYEF